LKKERPLAMDRVKLLCLFAGNSHALLGNDAQARFLDHGIDGAGQVALGRVGLEDRKSTLDRHRLFLHWDEWRIHESSLEKTGRAAYTDAHCRRQDRRLMAMDAVLEAILQGAAACLPVIECSRATTPGATSGYLTRRTPAIPTESKSGTRLGVLTFSRSRKPAAGGARQSSASRLACQQSSRCQSSRIASRQLPKTGLSGTSPQRNCAANVRLNVP